MDKNVVLPKVYLDNFRITSTQLGKVMDWKGAARLASKLVNKKQAATEQVIRSDLTGMVKGLGSQYARKVSKFSTDALDWGKKEWIATTEETHEQNWYLRSAKACESVSDSVMGNPDGISSKISRGVAAKLGAASTSVGIFTIASLLGTASTGTAIGTLSGAAFTSASLAWIGGSVVAGTAILGVASLAGGIGAAMGATWASKKFLYGEKRKLNELEL